MSRRLTVYCLALLFSGASASAEIDRSITLDNWPNHPGVKEVRAIHDEIRTGLKHKKYRTTTRRFNTDSPLCATYPVKSQALTVDGENRPRLYRLEQLGSHRERFTVERYYDVEGALRFVYVDRLTSNVRIYLTRERKVFWAVEKNEDKFTAFDSKDGDWETKPNSAAGAREAFQEQQPCPEMKR